MLRYSATESIPFAFLSGVGTDRFQKTHRDGLQSCKQRRALVSFVGEIEFLPNLNDLHVVVSLAL